MAWEPHLPTPGVSRSRGSVQGRKLFSVYERKCPLASAGGRESQACNERAGPGGGLSPVIASARLGFSALTLDCGELDPLLLQSVTESRPVIIPGVRPTPPVSHNRDFRELNPLSGTGPLAQLTSPPPLLTSTAVKLAQ